MLLKQKDVKASLTKIARLLDKPLTEALEGFTPNPAMKDVLKGYYEAWRDRTLHEFMIGVIASGHPGEPDVWTGEMEPFNLFIVLDEIYRQDCNYIETTHSYQTLTQTCGGLSFL